MTQTQWIMLIAFAIYIFLMTLAFKFPRTRDNWTKDRKESIQILMSATVFLMLFFLLWYVSYLVEWPDGITITVWVIAFTFLGLLLIGIFAPQGIRLRFEKKKAKVIDEEED